MSTRSQEGGLGENERIAREIREFFDGRGFTLVELLVVIGIIALLIVTTRVEEHVAQGSVHLARRAQMSSVVAVGEHRAAPAQGAVEPAGDPDLPALDAARQRLERADRRDAGPPSRWPLFIPWGVSPVFSTSASARTPALRGPCPAAATTSVPAPWRCRTP